MSQEVEQDGANAPLAVTESLLTHQASASEISVISLRVNGKAYPLMLDPRVTLLDALREYIGLTGTKKGCDHGQCGACTLLINDRRVNACLTLAIMVDDQNITTIEGLAQEGRLHPMQAAFIKHDGFQCGYCTPGQICSAIGMLSEGHAQTDADVQEQMSGNLCRCGAYPNILAAIQEARTQMQAGIKPTEKTAAGEPTQL